jgi:coenzyme F420-reducing hydrogenase beta subunit
MCRIAKYNIFYGVGISCVVKLSKDKNIVKTLTSKVWTKWTDVGSMQINTVDFWIMKLG